MELKSELKENQISANTIKPYTWKSVVTGGGGFVPGIIFHPAVPGLCYLRTDMGGAYRRDNDNGKWVNITDMFGKLEHDYYGILSIGLDPNLPDTVYTQNGKYTSKIHGNGTFHISRDRGNSWDTVMLPFKVGGNEAGRGCGERIAVDPDCGSNILMGSQKDGLWRSADSGKSWAKAEGFMPLSVNFVLFEKTGPQGRPRKIFAGAADNSGSSLFVSVDGGLNWEAPKGQPNGLMAMRADMAGRELIVTFSDGPGPYGVKIGAVRGYDTETGEWREFVMPEGEGGFSGVSVDRQNPGHLLVTTLNNYKPHDEVYRSIDGGKTWAGLIAGAEWDSSYAPYAGRISPHWISDVQINPFDSNKALWNTGYGIWATENLSAKKVKWNFDNAGIEQAVAMQIISPPSGACLYSAMGDIDGFRHDDPDKSPDTRYMPNANTTLSLALAWKKPGIMVKAFNSRKPYGAYSKNAGKTWVDFKSFPEGTVRGGLKSIALSADGAIILWAPKGAAMSRSGDLGATWEACRGIDEKILWPLADTQYPEKFYAYDGVKGVLYESADGGRSFTARAANLPKSPACPGDDGMADYSAAAVPGAEEEVFITTGSGGLFRIMNGSDGADRIPGVQEAYRVGFGRPAPGKIYPSVFIWAKIGGIAGFFISIDEGKTWDRINDDSHQYGWIHCITGDPKVYGRCYISAEGRGILYGEPSK
jgi:xyloglucan-specific exo-beta-1,4-glucanase